MSRSRRRERGKNGEKEKEEREDKNSRSKKKIKEDDSGTDRQTDRQTDILLTEIKVITDLFVIVIRQKEKRKWMNKRRRKVRRGR